jgi:cytochrome o ubiquinol oxidase subunit 3
MSKSIVAKAQDVIPVSQRGPASRRVVVGFGFWLFLLSDIIIFGSLFATYAVLANEVAGGPTGAQLFDRNQVLIETCLLLLSSISCGLMALAMERRDALITYVWASVTACLGVAFLGLELSEFARLTKAGAVPHTSAFLSSFYALVGAHGLHVFIGLLWLGVMMAQVATLGFRPMVVRRLLCFSLYWHALDIVWVGVFTIVYLGAH